MAVDITDLSTIYDEFLNKATDSLNLLQQDTQMEEEHYASAVATIITGAMKNSVNALETLERVKLIAAQRETETKRALDVESSTSVRNAQSTKDLLLKDAQIASEGARASLVNNQAATELKRALDLVSSTSVRNAQSTQDLLNKGAQKTLIDKQALKVTADTSFTTEQEKQLGYSVTYNNRLKTLENYSDTLGNLGIGGFVIPTSMWNTYFDMVNDCYINYGNVPASKTFTTSVPSTLQKA